MINAMIVVGFVVLTGWVAQQVSTLSPALIGGIVVLCGTSAYVGNRLAAGQRGSR